MFLNLFPTMFLAPLAYALLRVLLACAFLYLGSRHLYRDRRVLETTFREHWPRLARIAQWQLGIAEALIGVFFFLGLYTQGAAIAAAILSIKMLILRKRLPHPVVPEPLFWLLALAASLSLLITGAGAFAFDVAL